MRRVAMLLGVLLSAAILHAEDSAPPAPVQPAAPAPATSTPADATKPQDFKGELTVKGLDAKPGVVGLMKIPKGEKDVEWVDLLATGDLAKKVEDLAGQHVTVTITGTRGPDGITVTKVGDDVKLPPAKKKKKK